MRDKKTPERILGCLIFVELTWYFADGLFGPLYAVFTAKLGGDIFEVAGIYAAYVITEGSLQFVFGHIADKYKCPGFLLVIGLTLNTIAVFAFILVENAIQLLIVETVLGLSIAISTPTWHMLYSLKINKQKSGRAWSLTGGGSEVMTGIAILCGGGIVILLGFEVLFILMGSINTIIAIVSGIMFSQPAIRKNIAIDLAEVPVPSIV